jgi:altronate hydrolase
MMNQAITLSDKDNVAVCLQDLSKGTKVSVAGAEILLVNDIPAKHKFALEPLEKGDEIYMYGVLVGVTRERIEKGGAVTVDNITHQTSSYQIRGDHQYQWSPPDTSAWEQKTFMGYHREDGQVGTANLWLVFPLVFCENRNIEVLKNAFYRVLGYEQENKYTAYLNRLVSQMQVTESTEADPPAQTRSIFKNIDGVRFLTHQGGCGGTREDSETLCRLLAGYINNPNVAGATVLSLGCQNAQIELFRSCLADINPNFSKPLILLDQQAIGEEEALMQQAISQTLEGLMEANMINRKPAPLSKLTIGLECGGSDGFSGISANPTLGRLSDLVVALGGKAILSEFPELCGVEQELIDRIDDQQKAEKFSSLMRSYQRSAEKVGSGFDMNPSPGNIKDGLITDAIKSAGAAKKGGTSPIQDVLDYTEYAYTSGLSLLCTPGNDVESTTGLAGSGANIILFTTGLGTPTGNPVAQVIKVSSNSQLAAKMHDIIDVNTGGIIEGTRTIDQMGDELLDYIIEVASGRVVPKAVQLDQNDFIPWKRGVSL